MLGVRTHACPAMTAPAAQQHGAVADLVLVNTLLESELMLQDLFGSSPSGVARPTAMSSRRITNQLVTRHLVAVEWRVHLHDCKSLHSCIGQLGALLRHTPYPPTGLCAISSC